MRILFTGASFVWPSNPMLTRGLVKAAQLDGHAICQNLEDAPDLVVCLDYLPRFKRLLRRARMLGIPCLLIKQEPAAIIPQHRYSNPGHLFHKVITKGSSEESKIFNCLLSWDVKFIGETKRIEKVVAISADKWSFVPSELYSLRLGAYSLDPRIDVYGHGWSRGIMERLISLVKALYVTLASATAPKLSNLIFAFRKPLNYLGSAEDKALTLSRYKVALVIENDLSSMSEKLVDSILAGTIPVYVGPKTEPFGIPESLVVQAQPELSAVLNAISLALSWDSADYRRRALLWAENAVSMSNWNPEEVDARLLNHIVEWYTNHASRSNINGSL